MEMVSLTTQMGHFTMEYILTEKEMGAVEFSLIRIK